MELNTANSVICRGDLPILFIQFVFVCCIPSLRHVPFTCNQGHHPIAKAIRKTTGVKEAELPTVPGREGEHTSWGHGVTKSSCETGLVAQSVPGLGAVVR